MSKQNTQPKTAIQPTREQDYPEWYQQVIKAADLAEVSPVRGCMVIKPWGYGIWERIQKILDDKFKETGHVNAYFPLLIPKSFLEKEAEHVEGFAKECAVVTHHRLEDDGKGGLKPAGELEEPLIIRPTSETIIGASYAKWVQSYRDLPILINQWANVMRWEMRTRLFLRTTEFLWQEGHTVHATKEEAIEETLKMLDVYAWFAEKIMAMPVIKGEKTANERFPGAVDTYTIEAMMQDRKALQAGTSHFLGQNFAKSSGIQFSDQGGALQFAWTTSWGVSTRLIGGLIMTHSDDDGLVLPPHLAPDQIVIIPIYKDDSEKAGVFEACEKVQQELRKTFFADEKLRVSIDRKDGRSGEKIWHHLKRGVPLRIEIGPRDVAAGTCVVARRDGTAKDKKSLPMTALSQEIPQMLSAMQQTLFEKAKTFRDPHLVDIRSKDDFTNFFGGSKEGDKSEIHGGFARTYLDLTQVEAQNFIKELKVSARCMPLHEEARPGKCLISGRDVKKQIIFAKSY